MQRINLLDLIASLFSRDSSIIFTNFVDPLGNFEIYYPKNWNYDRDIAVSDGKYSISFEKNDNRFTVSVDISLPRNFEFKKYAKHELEDPSSGIYSTMKKTRFKNMPAYRREYSYVSGGKDYFGAGVIFFSGDSVFYLSWSAPENEKDILEPVFQHMLEKLRLHRGLKIRK